jgi:hypothetical protein
MTRFNARGHSNALIYIAISVISHDFPFEWTDNLVNHIIDYYRIVLAVFIAEGVLS